MGFKKKLDHSHNKSFDVVCTLTLTNVKNHQEILLHLNVCNI